MAIKPLQPMINKGLYYVTGLQLAYATTTTVTVAAGQARDSQNINDINLLSGITISTAANGANGLDVGTIANSTLYAVYAIGSSTANDPSVLTDASGGGFFQAGAGLLSLNASAPALPTGYDMYRRIGYVLTDGSAHILAFRQTGNNSLRTMWYDAGISVLAATAAAAFTAQSLAAAVPAQATAVTLQATLTPNAPGEFVALRPTGSSSVAGYAKLSGAVAAVAQIADMTVPCNATPSIDWITDAASTVALTVTNYLDQL